MAWIKHGLILRPSATGNWYHNGFSGSHAVSGGDGSAILYLTGRDTENRSRIGKSVIDLNTFSIKHISEEPMLSLGERGTFDFNGTGYPFYVGYRNQNRIYYTGWTKGVHVDFINDLGLAIEENDDKAVRVSRASILPRTDKEPFGCGSVCIMPGDTWKMWYTCFDKWEETATGLKHFYHIRFASSDDGIEWQRHNQISIDFNINASEYVVAKPHVIFYHGLYLMWYSYRGEAYKIGFAVSKDAINWERHDDSLLCLHKSENGWDSEMVCYASTFVENETLFMFYNGNGYGKSGLGVATMPESSLVAELKRLNYIS
jgi:hypothetical protein